MGILWRETLPEFKEKPCHPWNKTSEEDAHTQCNVIFTFLRHLLLAREHSLLSVSYRDLLLSPKPPGGQEPELKYFLLHYNSIIKCNNIYCSERMNLVNISDTCRKQYRVSLRECRRWLRVIWWQWLLNQTKGNLGAEIKRRTWGRRQRLWILSAERSQSWHSITSFLPLTLHPITPRWNWGNHGAKGNLRNNTEKNSCWALTVLIQPPV